MATPAAPGPEPVPVVVVGKEEEELTHKHTVSSVAKFGSRTLGDDDDVFAHNAWDQVTWDADKEAAAAAQVAVQTAGEPMAAERQQDLESNAHMYWDVFYGTHQNRFFKDRHWLGVEFPELTTIREGAASHTVLEVGCGVGNTVFPLLTQVEDPRLFVWACDFSATAVSIVQGSELYDTRRCKAFVCDIANEDIADTVPKASVDVVSMIFVLSALRPDKFAAALRRIYDVLKPGGLLIFRDYGRYDLAQLRFKPRAVIADNFYVRGDGTRVYFFAEDELKQLMVDGGYEIEQHVADRRLIVNRQRRQQMYRVWLQGKYRKPLEASSSSSSSAIVQ